MRQRTSYCFSQIPQTILSLFTSRSEGLPADTVKKGPYDQVVLLLIDAFGWAFFQKYQSQIPELLELEEKGIVSKHTSMFPSTTAAHITCINSGQGPGKSGIYEWFMHEPRLERVIAPLLFSLAGDKNPNSLSIDPTKYYPKQTIYETLNEQGISSRAFQPKNIANSTYSMQMLKGAEVFGYQKPKKGFDELLATLRARKAKSYSYFYYPIIDSVGHRKGVSSPEFFSAIASIFTDIKTFYQALPPKTALLITADHGMTDVNPESTFYLNKRVPNIEKFFLFGENNKPLTPAGSCRDYFLHVREEYLMELKEILEHFLEGKAEIYLTKELIELGFFGPTSQTFLSRVGNLVILPYSGEAVWWYEKGRFEQNFYAAHGGLTREEMEIPFIFLDHFQG